MLDDCSVPGCGQPAEFSWLAGTSWDVNKTRPVFGCEAHAPDHRHRLHNADCSAAGACACTWPDVEADTARDAERRAKELEAQAAEMAEVHAREAAAVAAQIEEAYAEDAERTALKAALSAALS